MGKESYVTQLKKEGRWQLMEMRASAMLAAAFARESFTKQSWPKLAWTRIFETHYQALLLFFGEVHGKGGQINGLPWASFSIQCNSQEFIINFGYPENETPKKADKPLIEDVRFNAIPERPLTTVQYHIGGPDGGGGSAFKTVVDEYRDWAITQLSRQLGHIPCDQIINSPLDGKIDLSTESRLHWLRIHLTEFLSRYLNCFDRNIDSSCRNPIRLPSFLFDHANQAMILLFPLQERTDLNTFSIRGKKIG